MALILDILVKLKDNNNELIDLPHHSRLSSLQWTAMNQISVAKESDKNSSEFY